MPVSHLGERSLRTLAIFVFVAGVCALLRLVGVANRLWMLLVPSSWRDRAEQQMATMKRAPHSGWAKLTRFIRQDKRRTVVAERGESADGKLLEDSTSQECVAAEDNKTSQRSATKKEMISMEDARVEQLLDEHVAAPTRRQKLQAIADLELDELPSHFPRRMETTKVDQDVLKL